MVCRELPHRLAWPRAFQIGIGLCRAHHLWVIFVSHVDFLSHSQWGSRPRDDLVAKRPAGDGCSKRLVIRNRSPFLALFRAADPSGEAVLPLWIAAAAINC